MIVRNLLRRKTRSLLTVLGIAIGVAGVVALGAIANGASAQFTSMLTRGGTDLTIVQAKVADMSLSVVDEEVGTRIAAMPAVEHVSGMIFTVVPLQGMPYFLIFGHDPKEYAIQHFKLVEGRRIVGSREIMIGRIAADYLKKKVGDTVRIYDSPYTIVGIYNTGVGYEDGGGVIALKDAQTIFKKPRQVNLLEVKLRASHRDRIDEVRAQILRRFSGINVSKSGDFAENSQDIQVTRAFAWGISALAIIVGGVGMMNTMLMSVFERTREIGVLRALGWRRWRILAMILQESLLLSAFGGLAGGAIGVGMVKLVELTAVGSSLAQGQFTPDLFLQGMAVALILGAIGGAYPAYRASRLSPLEALRYE